MDRIPRKLAGIGASDLANNAAFDAYIGPAREITVDPARGIIALHDGTTVGGKKFVVGANLNKASNLSDLADTSEARINLGLGSAAVQDVDAFMQPASYDPGNKKFNVYAQQFRDDSPIYNGAVGNGTTVDTTAYQATEAAKSVVYIPDGKIININTAFPSKPVHGPGKLKFGGQEYGGFELAYDPYRTSLLFTPDSYYRKTGAFPTSGAHLNVILSPGGPKNFGAINRSTFVGNTNAPNAVDLNRVELIGDGAGRKMTYAERCTMVGTIAGEQLGTQDFSDHNYWVADPGGFTPGQAGWNYDNLETLNPGIGVKIKAWADAVPFANSTLMVRALVGLGRDAFNGTVVGTDSTAIGYSALAGALRPQGMTALGTSAAQRAVFQTQGVFIGNQAGMNWQEGLRNVVSGYYAAANIVRGQHNTILGSYAGFDLQEANRSLLLGYGMGNTLQDAAGATLATVNDTFALGYNGTPLLSGKTDTTVVGVNIMPSRIRGRFHIKGDGYFGTDQAAHVNGDELILENSASVGMSFRSPIGSLQAIYFAVPGTTNRGGIIYNQNSSGVGSDSLTFRIGGADRFIIKGSGVARFVNLPPNYANDAAAATGGLEVGDVYRNGSVLMVRAA